MKTMWEQALDYLYSDLKKTRIALANAESKPGVKREELDDLTHKADVIEWLTALVLAKGMEDPKECRKAEDCRFLVVKGIWGACCLATKEIDPCKGDGCERWKAKEDAE
jgi:hypothetical protein